MGKQTGAIKFSGSIGDLNFYYTKNNGWLVRQKSTLSVKRFKTDPAFERARENCSNFSNSSSHGKILRQTFRELWVFHQDSKLCPRAVSLLHKIRKYDTTSDRGKFKTLVALENLQAQNLLKGFRFNEDATIANVLLRPFTANAQSGMISIAGFIPRQDLKAPHAATHAGFTCALGNLDFTHLSTARTSQEKIIRLDDISINILLTALPYTEPGIHAIALKIVFYQEINGELHLLYENKYCPVEIVDVAGI